MQNYFSVSPPPSATIHPGNDAKSNQKRSLKYGNKANSFVT
jgi:hypothetical protein